MPSESDRLLVQQIRQGDQRAWETLIARFEGRLLAFVNRRLQDRAASEDVVQESFIGFLNSLPNFDERRELQTYLFSIASHKLTDYQRKVGRHPLRALEDQSADEPEPYFDPHSGPSSILRSKERCELEGQAVARALHSLLQQWRDRGDYHKIKVIELLWVKGWTNRSIASFLGLDEQQVANIRFAAVRKLNEQVRNAGLSIDVFPELYEPKA